MLSQNQFFHRLGQRTLAPLLHAYILWLHESAKRDGIEHLIFFSRDGYLMQKAYQSVIPISQQIPSVYMFASRRLFNVAAIEVVDERVLRFLTSDRVEMPVRLYLQRIGLDALDCDVQLSRAGLADGLDTIVGPHNVDLLRNFFVAIEPEIVEHARSERAKLLRYADGLVDWSRVRCGVVDIGWNGSLQESLSKVLALEPGVVRGYYLCLERQARKDSRHFKRAYLDEAKPSDYLLYRHGVQRCIEMYELLFSEPAGSIVALDELSDGVFLPVRESYDAQSVQNRSIFAMQAVILQVVERLGFAARAHRIRPWLAMARLLSIPSPREVRVLGEIFHRSGFGGYGELGYLAKPMHPGRYYLRNPFTFFAELRLAYWRRGFMLRLLFDWHRS